VIRKFSALAFILFLIMIPAAFAQKTCVVYFTGIGCPHCAKTDPFVLEDLTKKFDDLVVIEFEIYQDQSNAPLMYEYHEKYKFGLRLPALLLGEGDSIVTDTLILNSAESALRGLAGNPCPLLQGTVTFEELDLSSMKGKPKIWVDGRAIEGRPFNVKQSSLLKALLLGNDVPALLNDAIYSASSSKSLQLSGKEVEFDNAVKILGVSFLWNDEGAKGKTSRAGGTGKTAEETSGIMTNMTIPKILSLAAVDAVNPCALAVLSLMLIAIITHNPENKRNVLLSGLAFTVSVFVMYLVYGLIIIRFLQVIQTLTSIRLVLYKVLGVAAIGLGILNIKDFIRYKPGGFGTEMSMFLRPTVGRTISGITSPKGAFVIGAFVTVFLLPCTIGPYVIAGGILSTMELLKTIPSLFLYNFVFVLPMLAITGIVYGGITSIENVSGWKDRNIKCLHLVAGAIIFLLGAAMIMGWV